MKKLFALARAILPRALYVGIRKEIFRRRTVAVFQKILRRKPLEVFSGPFRGMAFIPEGSFGAFLPLLIGSYESELHVILQEIVAREYDLIIDVGAAEGYYAVGLARAIPQARVLAYDIDPKARELCARLATKNAVADRVEIRTEANAQVLDAMISGKSLLICDCEGYEDELVDPAHLPKLANCDLLVEFHDFILPGVSQRITERLKSTHEVEIITAVPRTPEPALAVAPFLSRRDAAFACNELRPPGMQWGWFTARQSRPPNS